ncbi:GATA-binding factor A [Caerostris extrusa]|uniref:GATA-binding factor A n=1 Tax=Caerostris extrusa TaxID=172846 RepID=A0AAV4YB60_CAEEX|nr:GATA-binding factor A [Caerostris extrusa]
MTTMRETTKQDIYSPTEESEASKSYNNILREIAESQAAIPVPSNSPVAHFVHNSEFSDYSLPNCYENYEKGPPSSQSDMAPLIVNNIVAHQHLPTETCFSIKPAHSSSLIKSSSNKLKIARVLYP